MYECNFITLITNMSRCWNYINALKCISLVLFKKRIRVINARNMEHLKLVRFESSSGSQK